jgi:hypothetical protein
MWSNYSDNEEWQVAEWPFRLMQLPVQPHGDADKIV